MSLRRGVLSIFEITGRVFIVASYLDEVVMGACGFTEACRKNGIVLVFNAAKMNFSGDTVEFWRRWFRYTPASVSYR